MSLDSVKEFLSGFESLPQLPDPGALVGYVETIARVLVIAGPAVMVILGLLYLFAAPKEANHHFGYRCYFGMGSELAWQFTQRVAGITWTALGSAMTIAALVISRRFAELGTLDMLTGAAVCLLAEAGVLLMASIVIRTIVAARYDRHGERRQRKVKNS